MCVRKLVGCSPRLYLACASHLKVDGVGRKVDQRVCFDVKVDQCGADYLSVRDEETWEWQRYVCIYVAGGSCV